MMTNRLPILLFTALALAAAPQTAPSRPKPATRQPAAAPKTPIPTGVPRLPSQLKYPPLGRIQIPPVTTYTLSNGMKVFLLEDHELPLVSGLARIRTGNLFDPPDKVGLAGVTGTVMRSGGTQSKTGDQLDEELENIAARVESGIGETSGSVSFSTLKENTDEVMGIFHDVLTAPEFRQDKIELEKSQLRSAISRRNDSPGGISQREFANIVYGRNTPYGWEMQYATVNRIERPDLLAFYKRYYFPANILLAVWGDFDTAEMKAKLEKLFGGWNYTQSPVPAFPKVATSPQPGIFLAKKTDVTQTFFAVGHLGGELRDKDFAALEIMADILGGGFKSRLMQRIRSQMGAAYAISASWAADYDHPGLFEISGSTNAPSTTETLRIVNEEVERIRTTEVSEEELKTARETALNSLVFAFDNKTKTLGRLLTYEYYGYPRDFIQEYQKALAAVTRADVLAAAKKHLDPQIVTVVAVGNPQDFSQSLAALGMPVHNIDLTIPEAKPEAAPADAASLARGKQLLARAQQAVGGADKLAAVHDVVETASFALQANGMKVTRTNRWLEPKYFRQESQLPAGKIVAYTDGSSGWIVTPQGSGVLAGPQLRQVQGDVFRFYPRLLLSDRLPGRTVNAVRDNTLEITGQNGESARLVLNPDTGMPERVIYETVHVAGPPITVEDRYTKFGEASGIQVPMAITIIQGGRKFADIAVEDYKVNTGLKPEDLSKRP